MKIVDMAFAVINDAERAMFPDDVAALLPSLNADTVKSACYDLRSAGRVRAMKSSRGDKTSCCVFYVKPSQIKDIEGLRPYHSYKHRSTGKVITREAEPVPDVLIMVPIEGDNEVTTLTLSLASIRKLHKTLSSFLSS